MPGVHTQRHLAHKGYWTTNTLTCLICAGFTQYPLKWKENGKDKDRWETSFDRVSGLVSGLLPIVTLIPKLRKGFYIRFMVDFDKNQCITKIYNNKNKEDRTAFNFRELNFAEEMIWPIPKEVDIIPTISSNDNTVVEIRLGAVEYRR